LAPPGLLIVGIVILMVVMAQRRWRRRCRRLQGLPTSATVLAAATGPRECDGVVWLRPSWILGGHLVGGVGGAVAIALVVVGLGYIDVPRGMRTLSWIALAGIGCGWVRAIINRRRPWIRCGLDSPYPRLGQPFVVSWTMPDATACRPLAIFLEGVEKFVAGDHGRPSFAVFAVIPVLMTNEGEVGMAGSREITLSPAMMHSFTASHHRVLWRLVVFGRCRFGMTRTMVYEIVVMPAGTAAKGVEYGSP
ncbi:MAG: hypothetical protein PHQ27_09270, partial [Victivallales bacterium]|nr:hypothetical protein [Victivallales bacterium]